jgi:signal transduction histidine kinase
VRGGRVTRWANDAGPEIRFAIAKSLVEAHHGQIWLESTPGSGTTVSFTLPKPGAEGHPARVASGRARAAAAPE